MRIGIIADDFTGATDIASFLVENGLTTIQFNGTPNSFEVPNTDAIVISLKSRSCPVDEAVNDSLVALEWLKNQGCDKFYFKYCSTFDSTKTGNIGPVTDALMEALGCENTIVCPALPVNGRCVINGHLFVHHQLLNESGMRDHPVTPMLESKVDSLMERQSKGQVDSLFYTDVDQGAAYLNKCMTQLFNSGVSYVVFDAFNDEHLRVIAEASIDLPLVTGGSGLAAGIAQVVTKDRPNKVQSGEVPPVGLSVVLSGSCSEMTNSQVNLYKSLAPHFEVDIGECIHNSEYAEEICRWVMSNQKNELAPMVYATASKEQLKIIQNKYGEKLSSETVEVLFSKISHQLQKMDVVNFIVAGGETSGSVTKALKVEGLDIGAQIVPGVPWVKALYLPVFLALKSGNFGDVDFFVKAQKMIVKK